MPAPPLHFFRVILGFGSSVMGALPLRGKI
jgi:hypothetical protein